MDFEKLYRACTSGFDEGFARRTATDIIETNSIETFFDVLDYAVAHQKQESILCFRSMYVLESIYLSSYDLTEDQKERIFRWVPTLQHKSAQRHISKILSLEIQSCRLQHKQKLPLSDHQMHKCVESLAEWLIDEKSKVAVQIWALEALLVLRTFCAQTWQYPHLKLLLTQILPTCVEIFTTEMSPGKQSRMKQWKARGLL